ncbi:MAG TPA: hypothetical protein PK941_02420 [Paludibacter sp.]|nr:hypothetical protein [Paludibacter sp.]
MTETLPVSKMLNIYLTIYETKYRASQVLWLMSICLQTEKVSDGCYVKIGKIEGSEILYHDEVHGSLIIMADRVIDLRMLLCRLR